MALPKGLRHSGRVSRHRPFLGLYEGTHGPQDPQTCINQTISPANTGIGSIRAAQGIVH